MLKRPWFHFLPFAVALASAFLLTLCTPAPAAAQEALPAPATAKMKATNAAGGVFRLFADAGRCAVLRARLIVSYAPDDSVSYIGCWTLSGPTVHVVWLTPDGAFDDTSTIPASGFELNVDKKEDVLSPRSGSET